MRRQPSTRNQRDGFIPKADLSPRASRDPAAVGSGAVSLVRTRCQEFRRAGDPAVPEIVVNDDMDAACIRRDGSGEARNLECRPRGAVLLALDERMRPVHRMATVPIFPVGFARLRQRCAENPEAGVTVLSVRPLRLTMKHRINYVWQAVSQHLGVLETDGLMRAMWEGRSKLCRFACTPFETIGERRPILMKSSTSNPTKEDIQQ